MKISGASCWIEAKILFMPSECAESPIPWWNTTGLGGLDGFSTGVAAVALGASDRQPRTATESDNAMDRTVVRMRVSNDERRDAGRKVGGRFSAHNSF